MVLLGQSSRRIMSKRAVQRSGLMLVLLGLLFLSGGLLVGFVRMAWQEHQINRAIQHQLSQNAAQEARNLSLAGQAAFAESDVAAEKAARERLGMAREGDTVLLPTVVLPAAPPPVPSEPLAMADAPGTELPQSNVARWAKALFPGPDALP